MNFDSNDIDAILDQVAATTNFELTFFYPLNMKDSIEKWYGIKLESKRQKALGLIFIELPEIFF